MAGRAPAGRHQGHVVVRHEELVDEAQERFLGEDDALDLHVQVVDEHHDLSALAPQRARAGLRPGPRRDAGAPLQSAAVKCVRRCGLPSSSKRKSSRVRSRTGVPCESVTTTSRRTISDFVPGTGSSAPAAPPPEPAACSTKWRCPTGAWFSLAWTAWATRPGGLCNLDGDDGIVPHRDSRCRSPDPAPRRAMPPGPRSRRPTADLAEDLPSRPFSGRPAGPAKAEAEFKQLIAAYEALKSYRPSVVRRCPGVPAKGTSPCPARAATTAAGGERGPAPHSIARPALNAKTRAERRPARPAERIAAHHHCRRRDLGNGRDVRCLAGIRAALPRPARSPASGGRGQ